MVTQFQFFLQISIAILNLHHLVVRIAGLFAKLGISNLVVQWLKESICSLVLSNRLGFFVSVD